MPSIFARPVAVRQAMQTISGAVREVRVRNENELRAALVKLPAPDATTDDGVTCRGRTIIIAEDITLQAPLTLTTKHAYLTLTALGFARLMAGARLAEAIRLEQGADRIRLDRLFFDAQLTPLGVAAYFDTAVRVVGTATVTGLILTDCLFKSPQLIITDTDAGISIGHIDGNLQQQPASEVFAASVDPTIDVDMLNGTICGNIGRSGTCRLSIEVHTFSADARNIISGNNTRGGDISIPDGGGNVVMGNVLAGGDIISNTGAGLNTIVANTEVGALTTAGTDAVGLNT